MKHHISLALRVLMLGAALILPRVGQAAESTYKNSIGMEFVLIPAGTFLMGSADDWRSLWISEPRDRTLCAQFMNVDHIPMRAPLIIQIRSTRVG
jgi:formylglycine-generating enzyme required for sulfatase activity